jgi:hypothetical protein
MAFPLELDFLLQGQDIPSLSKSSNPSICHFAKSREPGFLVKWITNKRYIQKYNIRYSAKSSHVCFACDMVAFP